MTEPNLNLCFSRKASKGDGYNLQCPNKKKIGNYCGKHIKCIDNYKPLVKNIESFNDNGGLPLSDNGGLPLRDNPDLPKVIEIKQPPVVLVEKILVEEKKQYQNDTDFFTLESIQFIPKEYFYEYLENNQYYAFDIRTLYEYLNSCNLLETIKNPFTNIDIPNEKIEGIKRKYRHLEKKGIQLDQYKEEIMIEPHKKLEWRCLDIFQKIDHLGHYVDYKWFWNLTLYELKKMYLGLEDLWNYRLPITKLQKQRILPHYTPFLIINVQQYNMLTDLTVARQILLDEIEKFVTMGKLEGKNGNDNKYVGSILVLTSLVEVSKTAASVLPHLVPIL